MSRTPEIRETLIDMCRPFGNIEYCRIHYEGDGRCQCVLRLADAGRQGLAASTLGATLENEELHLEIRLPARVAAPAELEADEGLLVAIEET